MSALEGRTDNAVQAGPLPFLTQSGHWLAAFVERELWNIGCERTGPALLSIDIRRVDHLGAPPAREELSLGGRGAVNRNPGKPVDV
jgi:hypothetical protein